MFHEPLRPEHVMPSQVPMCAGRVQAVRLLSATILKPFGLCLGVVILSTFAKQSANDGGEACGVSALGKACTSCLRIAQSASIVQP